LLVSEAEWLRRQGLGTRVTCRDVLVFDGTTVVDNELRYPDECVRHKALDLIGDLSLAGVDLIGRFVAHKSGHRLNATMVEALMATGRWVLPVRQSA
jgi:UDP-3-O-acyl-N-acetylglucosamine deacetylase